MKCVFCNSTNSKVIDSRALKDGSIRRRRECEDCGMRFSSYEMVESNPLMVTNVLGERESFKYEKLFESVAYCVYSRHIDANGIQQLTDEIERRLLNMRTQEITTIQIVSVASQCISESDEVAAFVYHIQHNDINSLLDVKRFF